MKCGLSTVLVSFCTWYGAKYLYSSIGAEVEGELM